MDRRKFLTVGAIGTAGMVAGCDCAEKCGVGVEGGPAVIRRRRELKMVTSWPKNFPGLGDAAESVAKRITAMSDGDLTVEVFAANELVGAFESFDAVSSGAADMYHAADYYWGGKSTAYPFFTAVPFGMTASEIMAWTQFGGGQELWDELAARYNIKPFAAGNTGHQLGGWFKKEINSLEDMRGLTMRMPGLGGEVLRRIGAAAVSRSGDQIFQALQSGSIDATEWVGPWNDLAFGFYQEAPYYYWPGIHEPGAQLAVGMNLEVWNDLSASEREIVKAACSAANDESIAKFTHFNGIALRTLIEDRGVQLRRMPEDVLTAMAEAAIEVYQEAAASEDITRRVYESFSASLARSMEWGAISDEAYMAARRTAFAL